MTPFTSRREQHLWLALLVVVGAVYATLGLAGALAEVLRNRNMLDASFAIAFLLVAAAVVGSALKRRPGGREMWVALGVTAVLAMVLVRMGIGPEERTHLFEYGLIGVLAHQALEERRQNGGRVPFPMALAVTLTALLGWLDEGIQAFLPNRVYDVRDIGVNAFAGLMAVLAAAIIARARQSDFLRGSSSS